MSTLIVNDNIVIFYLWVNYNNMYLLMYPKKYGVYSRDSRKYTDYCIELCFSIISLAFGFRLMIKYSFQV